MTSSPSEKETKEQLDAVLARAKAKAAANPQDEHAIAQDLLRKVVMALASSPKQRSVVVTDFPLSKMAAALNETKRQVYAIFDNHPIGDEYRGDLASMVLVSILEDCAEGLGLTKAGVSILVKHTQEVLRRNFITETERDKRTNPKS